MILQWHTWDPDCRRFAKTGETKVHRKFMCVHLETLRTFICVVSWLLVVNLFYSCCNIWNVYPRKIQERWTFLNLSRKSWRTRACNDEPGPGRDNTVMKLCVQVYNWTVRYTITRRALRATTFPITALSARHEHLIRINSKKDGNDELLLNCPTIIRIKILHRRERDLTNGFGHSTISCI